MIKEKTRYTGVTNDWDCELSDVKAVTRITEDNIDELEKLDLINKDEPVVSVDRRTWKTMRKECRRGRTFELNNLFGGKSYYKKYGKNDYRNVDTGARVFVSSKLSKLGYEITETNQNTVAGKVIHNTITNLNSNDMNEVSSSIQNMSNEDMKEYKEVA